MKRVLLGLIAITIMSATLYADGRKEVKNAKSECCTKDCCDDNCTKSATVYAAKRGLIIHKGGTCTCC